LLLVIEHRDDLVLAPEAREREHPRERERADAEDHGRDRQVLPEAAHLAHVLRVRRVDDDARAQEEQRFEEGVRHEMVEPRDQTARTERDEHVAELADRRVRQHLLDVVLHRRHEAAGECRERADGERDGQGNLAHLEDRERPRHEVHAGCDHRRGVDERGRRRGARHRIGQPHVQWQLGGLAHGAEEQQQRHGGSRRRCPCKVVKHDRELERAGGREHGHQPQHETDVADARREERLERRLARRLLLVPEADQEVRAQAHDFPRHEELQEVVSKHERQHRSGEEGQHRVVPADALVSMHVAERIDLHGNADDRHDEKHERRGGVHEQARGERRLADVRERGRHMIRRLAAVSSRPLLHERDHREDERHDTNARPRPISAAETTIEKTAKNWPVIAAGSVKRLNATRLMFTAFAMSSRHMSTITALLRESAPYKPSENSTSESARNGRRPIG